MFGCVPLLTLWCRHREWAPSVRALCLIGDFNDWKAKDNHWAVRNQYGVWELFLPDGPDGAPAIPHRSKVKCRMQSESGELSRERRNVAGQAEQRRRALCCPPCCFYSH